MLANPSQKRGRRKVALARIFRINSMHRTMSQHFTFSLVASRIGNGVAVAAADVLSTSIAVDDRLVAGLVVLLSLLISVLILT